MVKRIGGTAAGESEKKKLEAEKQFAEKSRKINP